MIYSADLLRGLIKVHQKTGALQENAHFRYEFLKNTLANTHHRKKKFKENKKQILQLALTIYIKCQHLQELALRFRQRIRKKRGKPLQNFEVSEVEKEWVSNYTSLSSAYFHFFHIFFSSARKCQALSCYVEENEEWRSTENNSDDGTTDFFFFIIVYVNLDEGYECFKPL